MKKVLIVEDNVKSLETLKKIVRSVDSNLEIKCVTNIDNAYAIAMQYDIDLFLVDIIMNPKVSSDVFGMTFAYNIRMLKRYQYTPIVIISSLEDPKLYAYSDIHCYSYIEKPYKPDNVSRIVKEALDFPKKNVDDNNIFLRKDGILYKRAISEIVYIEIYRERHVIHSVDDELELPYKSCQSILAELKSDKFIQCSRSMVVNKDYIDSVDAINRYITLKGRSERIEIGAVMRKKFLKDLLDE